MKYILPSIVTLFVITLLMSQSSVFAQTTIDYGGSTMTVTPQEGICVQGECKWTPEVRWDIDFEIQVNSPTNDGVWFWVANWDDNITIESYPSYCNEIVGDVVKLNCEISPVSAGQVITGTLGVNAPDGTEWVCGDFVLGVLENNSIEGGNESEKICKGVRTTPAIPPGSWPPGGCLIATATYGSELAPQVQQLREIRDNVILETDSGMAFMTSFNQFYYSFSPGVADFERENPIFKEVIKVAITPFISSLSILNYVNMDSDVEVLGYLTSMALLNIGMYVAAPALIGFKVNKYFKSRNS